MSWTPSLETLPLAEVSSRYGRFETRRRVKLFYKFGRRFKGKYGHPSGLYVLPSGRRKAEASIVLRRPLVIEWGSLHGESSWVTQLQRFSSGRKGERLSSFLGIKRRFDSIVLVRRNRVYQVILLRLPQAKARERFYSLFGLGPKALNTSKVSDYGSPQAEVSKIEKWVGQNRAAVEEYGNQIKKFSKLLETETDSERRDELEGKLEDAIFEKEDAEYYIWDMETNELPKLREKLAESGPMSEKEMFQEILGASSAKEALLLAGAGALPEAKYKIEVGIVSKTRVYMMLSGGPVESMHRTFYKHGDGTIHVENEHFKLKKNAPPGLGTKVFYSQVLACQARGISYIECEATRSQPRFGYVGYYVWPRLGFNAPLRSFFDYNNLWKGSPQRGVATENIVHALLDEGLLPDHITYDTPDDEVTFQDLMQTKEGREWWKKWGDDVGLRFDLTPNPDGRPNRSVQVLEEYIRLRSERQGDSTSEWYKKVQDTKTSSEQVTMPSLYAKVVRLAHEKPETRKHLLPILKRQASQNPVEEIQLTEEDDAILDEVWDRLSEKWQREDAR